MCKQGTYTMFPVLFMVHMNYHNCTALLNIMCSRKENTNTDLL